MNVAVLYSNCYLKIKPRFIQYSLARAICFDFIQLQHDHSNPIHRIEISNLSIISACEWASVTIPALCFAVYYALKKIVSSCYEACRTKNTFDSRFERHLQLRRKNLASPLHRFLTDLDCVSHLENVEAVSCWK